MSGTRNLAMSLFALVTIGAIISGAFARAPSRIRGGSDALPGTFTFVVSLSYRDIPHNHYCGGAIISPRHILTAGHCIDKDDINQVIVRSGLQRLDDDNAIVSEIKRAIIYPGYISYIPNYRSVENDIAILELEKDLVLGGKLNKVKLPNSPPMYGPYYHIAGWGDNDTAGPNNEPNMLQVATGISLLDDDNCYFKGSGLASPSTLCGLKKDASICAGDSGSPLVSRGIVYGVASTSFCRFEISHFYANVYHFVDWIKSVIDE